LTSESARSLEPASPASPASHSPLRFINPNKPIRNGLSCETPRRIRFPGGAGIAGGGVGRDIDSPVPRNSANHTIAETERRGPGKGSRRRISYRHESRPLTEVAWSMRSPEVAQSGLAEAVLACVLLRRLPASVRMRLPTPCSVSGTAHGKADSRRFHQPVPPRARSASSSLKRRQQGRKATSSFRGRIGRPPRQPALATPARSSPDPAACGPEIDRSRVRRSICRFRNRPPACLAAAALAFGPIVAREVLRSAD